VVAEWANRLQKEHPAMPRVSFIIPCYNAERFLGEAIQSVLEQVYDDFEVIVVDDGSTDHTRQLVETFDDPRIRYIYQENRGPGGARNTAAAAAKGDYLAFLDADDIALPHRLTAQLRVLEKDPTVSVVASGYVWIGESGQRIPWNAHSWQGWPELNDLGSWLFDCPLVPSATMLRRDAWADVGGFEEGLRGGEDWNFWMRLVLAGHRMTWHRDVVCLYRRQTNSLSHDALRMSRDCLESLRRVLARPDFPPYLLGLGRQALAIRHLDGAKRLYASGLCEEGMSAVDRALALHPQLLDGLPSRVEDEIVSTCLDPLVAEPISLLRQILDHLPRSAGALEARRGQMITRCHVELLARGLRQRHYRLVRKHLLPAVVMQARWLLDRGMWAIALRAVRNWVGRRGRASRGVTGKDAYVASEHVGVASQSVCLSERAQTQRAMRASLTSIAGAALADIGVAEASAPLLESVALTIHGLEHHDLESPSR